MYQVRRSFYHARTLPRYLQTLTIQNTKATEHFREMRDTIFCVSCDSRADADECTTICNSCLDLSFRAKAQWISVKDRLPDKNVEVLVCLNGDVFSKQIELAMLFTEGWYFGDDWSNGYASGFVTHWIALPEPPTC